MAQKFVNDWFAEVIASDRLLSDALYSLQPRALTHAVQRIRDFQGAKVMLSCTDRTPLAEVVKQALYFADLVIIVPAPLWASCIDLGTHPYASFNYKGVGLASSCHFSPGLLENLSRLIVEETQVFNYGAITFLPVLGESQHRWSHPELALPELPRPYSGDGGRYSPLNVYVEALYGLCSERLAAERLGAMHLNTASFTEPVFGDLTIGKLQAGWVHYLCEISVPDLSRFSLSDIARFRRELPEAASQFSRATRRVLSLPNADRQTTKATIEDLQNSATIFTQQIESALAPFGTSNHLSMKTVVFGLGGQQGGTSATVDFIQKGGTLHDLARLIIASGGRRLEVRQDSFWAGTTDPES